ncbi:MAG: lecithin retinol acyltransferase family protein [Synergistaceae bacterium]|nr:lecithin retinol acyltransferase family protein [Synergistaceae bacterium]
MSINSSGRGHRKTLTSSQAENGDVIKVNRGLYSHYGVYVKDSGTVIHYTGATGPADFNGMVRETSLEEFLNGAEGFTVCKFEKTPDKLLPSLMMKRRGVFQLWQMIRVLRLMSYHLYSGAETIERARSKLGQGGYNLALNNCEHFAVWCKTGVKDSSQVDNILDLITYALS